MTDAAEAFRLADRFMDEMALADAEAIPGIHLDRQDPDQRFDQPGPEGDSRCPPHPSPAAECGDGVIDADDRLSHHHPTQGTLARLTVRFMGTCCELTADAGDVFRMNEVEAGVGAQPAGQPEPTGDFAEPLREIAGREGAGAVHTPSEHQGWEHRDDLGRQWMLLQLLQAAGLGLDVFGAVGQGLR